MRRARGLGGGGAGRQQGLASEAATRWRATLPATTRPQPMQLASFPPPPSTSRLLEHIQRRRASTRAKASSSSSSSNSSLSMNSSVSPLLPSSRSFPTSAVLASLSAGNLDEALRHVILAALATAEGFRDASEEGWSELMRPPMRLDFGGDATTSSTFSSSSSSSSSSDAVGGLPPFLPLPPPLPQARHRLRNPPAQS